MINYQSDQRLKIIFAYTGTVLPRVIPYTLVMVLWSLALILFFEFTGLKFEMSSQAHSIVALGLLLVFRTNTSMTVTGKVANNWAHCALQPAI